VRYRQNGRVVAAPATGPVHVDVAISNATTLLVHMPDALADPGELAGLLDALRRQVLAGRRPIAGEAGVPLTLTSTSAIGARTPGVQIPLRVRGTIAFPGLASMTGPAAAEAAGVGAVRFDALLPSAAHPDGSLAIGFDAVASRPVVPDFGFRVSGALPDPAELTAPGGSWTQAFAGASDAVRRDALARAQTAMWQVLLRPQLDAYIGNPGKGPSRTVYTFVSARAAPLARHAPAERFRPLSLALVLAAAALAIGDAALLWARS